MRVLGKEVIEELIMNLKDAGCDEELITKCIKKYNNDDLKMLIKSLLCPDRKSCRVCAGEA